MTSPGILAILLEARMVRRIEEEPWITVNISCAIRRYAGENRW